MKNLGVMGWKKGRFFMMFVLAYAMLSLCACSGPGNGVAKKDGTIQRGNGAINSAVSPEQMVSYENRVYELDGDLLALMDARFWEGSLYYYKLDDEKGCYGIERVRSEDGKSETYLPAEAFFEEGEQEECAKEGAPDNAGQYIVRRSMRCFDLTKDGGVLALVALYDEENEYGVDGEVKEWILMEFDAFGNFLKSIPLESGIIPKDTFYPKLRVDGDGNVLLILTKQFILLDKAGKKLAEYPIEEGCFVKNCFRGSDGKLIFTISNTQGEYVARRVNYDKKALEELEGMPEMVVGLGSIQSDDINGGSAEDCILVFSPDALYSFRTAKKELTELLQWSESGVFGAQVYSVTMHGQRIMALSTKSGTGAELTVLTPNLVGTGQNGEQAATGAAGGNAADGDREIITLGVLYKWTTMDNYVTGYNRSQKKYKVVIRKYGELPGNGGIIHYQEPNDRMMMDILGEDAPDLLELTPYLNGYDGLSTSPQDMLEKGYVVDLRSFLDASSAIGRESFEQKVLDAFTFEKGLPAIPTSFCIRAFCVSRKDLENRLGWSVSELMAYDRANPVKKLSTDATSSYVFNICTSQTMDAFVDLENGTVNFDCPQFREILEYAHTYPAAQGGEAYRIYDEDGLVNPAYVEALLNVQSIPRMHFDGEGQFVGYPTMDGSPRFLLGASPDAVSLGICAASEKKEGAWDFVEYVLTHDFANGSSGGAGISSFGGIPTNKEILEKHWKALKDDDVTAQINHMQLRYGNDIEYNTHYFTQEEVDLFHQLLDCAVAQDPRMKQISSIVSEELQPYFNDQKSMDQVIEIIEGRVWLYLEENR